MYKLDLPHMAINGWRIPQKYNMLETYDAPAGVKREVVIAEVVKRAKNVDGGKFSNLVINCHGSPGSIALGQGFRIDNVAMFSAWKGLVDKIWVTSCNLSDPIGNPNRNGGLFCKKMAQQFGGYLVVSTEGQCPTDSANVPYGKMTSYEGLVLCYGPDGTIIWNTEYKSAGIVDMGEHHAPRCSERNPDSSFFGGD